MSPTENPTTDKQSPAGEQAAKRPATEAEKGVFLKELCRRATQSGLEAQTAYDVKLAEEALLTGDIYALMVHLDSLLTPFLPFLDETKKHILDEIVSKGYLFPLIIELKFIRIREFNFSRPMTLPAFLEKIHRNYFKQVLESGDIELLTTITSKLLSIFGTNIDHTCSDLSNNIVDMDVCADPSPILFALTFSEHLFAVLERLKKRNRKRLLDYIIYYWGSRDYVLRKKDLIAKFESTRWGNRFLKKLTERSFSDFDSLMDDADGEERTQDILKTFSRAHRNLATAFADDDEGPFPDDPLFDDEPEDEMGDENLTVTGHPIPPANAGASVAEQTPSELSGSFLKKAWRALRNL